jgi:hypothetical protein
VDHPLVVAIALEQLLAVRKKGGIRQAVILEDDRLGDLGEDPVEPARDPALQPEVLVGEFAHDLARPVHILDHRPGLRAEPRVLGVARPRPVRDHQQLRGARLADSLEHPGGELRPPEDDQGHSGFHQRNRATRLGSG